MTSGIGARTNKDRDIQVVAVTAVNIPERKAECMTRIRSMIYVDISYPVGGIYITPSVGDQWYVERIDTIWRLFGRIPFNDNNIQVDPVEGQQVFGGTGPVVMNGSTLDIRSPLQMTPVPDDEMPDPADMPPGTIIYSESQGLVVSDGSGDWVPTGSGGGGDIEDIEGLSEILDTKISKPIPPLEPGVGTKISYDENGLVVGGDTATTADISGLDAALESKSDIGHIHDEEGEEYTDPLTTKGDLLARTDTASQRKGVGVDGTWLRADSTQLDGLLWASMDVDDVTGLLEELGGKHNVGDYFEAFQIPGLDCSKIISGIFGQSQIPLLDLIKIPFLPADWITSGSFLASLIPGLDASKITTGIFSNSQMPLLDLLKIPFLPASQITTGTFVDGLIPGLDVSKIISGIFPVPRIPALDATQITSGTFPQNMIQNLAINLGSIFTTITSPTQAHLLQNVPVSSVGQFTPELLTNPTYDSAGSVLGGSTAWVWDPTVSHTAGGTGSVKVTADPTVQQLLSDPPIPVSPNQQLAVSHWLRWSELVRTPGVGFTLGVVAYLGTGISNTINIQSITTPAVNSDWVQLSGTYTVPATGVDNIRLQLLVESNVTAGTIHWDDGSVKKTQLLRQDWTSGLLGDLNNLTTGVNARTLITDTTALMSSLGLGTPTLTAITNRLAGLGSGGLYNSAGLTNMAAFPGIDASKILSGALSVLRIPTWDLNRTNILDLGSTLNQITNGLLGGQGYTQAGSANSTTAARGGLDSIFADVINATTQLQAMRSENTGLDVSGKNIFVSFSSYEDGPLPSNFTTTYSGAGTSQIGTSGGKAGWRTQVNDGNRNADVIFNAAPTNTDFQIVRGTLSGPPPGGGSGGAPRISAVGRVDNPANPQNYVWARGYCVGFLAYRGDMGCTVNGVETVWVSNVPLTWSMDINFVVGVGTNARRYQVFSGSKQVIDYTEVGTVSMLGSGYRYWGCRTETRTDSGGAIASPYISATSVSDNAPPDVVGSGGHMVRTNAAGVGMATGVTKVANNFFDINRYHSADIVPSLVTNSFTVTYAGWYMVEIGLGITGEIFESWNTFLFVNGVGVKAGGPRTEQQLYSHSSFVIYLKMGDTVAPGTYRSGGSNSVLTGEATGTWSYFSIALMNRSYA